MKRKSSAEIGKRAYSELIRLFPGKSDACIARKIGCRKQTVYFWRDGHAAPSPMMLERMVRLGADVIWILTGGTRNEIYSG